MSDQDFPEQNRASAVLAKVGGGCADADFARAMGEVLDAAKMTGKKARLVLTVEVNPRADLGCVEVRADTRVKLPRLPAPASQMHLGNNNELLTQMEWMMGGGKDEKPKALAITTGVAAIAAAPQAPVAAAPAPAPVAAAPTPAPLAVGKEAGAGKD